ncbi:hypothetical protein COMNV_00325 [Commensalibacter sp. Nvir]|uniref:TIGR02300 family protein n=1 Tax=Commensalibacter sp. Nvir TaxID=3069817 RepID=UPI002D5C456B|nr:hypothetical protein COMNV_00325 [Commensalibacter sp. Nvir]
MVKVELGIKRICCSCGTRFYDLNKTPPVCYKCGTEQPIELPRGRPFDDENSSLGQHKEISATIDPDDLDAEDETIDDVIEDTSDLEDDVEAIGAEIEVSKVDDDGDS